MQVAAAEASVTPAESAAWCPGHPGGSIDILPLYAELSPRIPMRGVFVEIGSFFGRSLAFMGHIRPDMILYAVDPWDEGFVDAGEVLPLGADAERCKRYGGLFAAFLGTMREFHPDVLARVRPIRAPSTRGLRCFDDASVDFCFIDGDHAHAAVVADCIEALRIVKPGGIIAGHDMGWRGPVYQAFFATVPGAQMASWPEEREGWEPGESSCAWAVR